MKKAIALFLLTALLLTGCAQNRSQSEPIAPEASTSPVPQTVPTTETVGEITEEEARSLAISHAGLTQDQVTFVKSGLDRDDGRKVYDIEFYTEDFKEYDYEISAVTGEIMDFDYDAEYYAPPAVTSGDGTITEDEAKAFAIGKVPGATLSDIREFETDYDDGRLEYEGTIIYDKMEYEFEIDGISGEILNWEAESIYD